jgi:protein SCO1/2
MKLSRLFWITSTVLVLGTLFLWLLLAKLQQRAHVQQGGEQNLPIISQVTDFTLTNQNNQLVTLSDLRGKVWIADIIFTRCTGPCLKMTREMKELQDALPGEVEPRLVTLTTDPDYDTPGILKKRAELFGANPNRWMFLTGTKTEIAKLATNSLKLAAVEKHPEERTDSNDLFIHSTIFVIVDRQARLRGVFETVGDTIDFQQVKPEILKAVRQLQRES